MALWLLTISMATPQTARAQDWQARKDWLIRVVLSDDKTAVQCGGELDWSAEGKKLGASGTVVDIKRVGDKVKLIVGGKAFEAKGVSATPGKGYCRYGGKDYRGRLDFFPAKSTDGLVVLNVLPLEEYLLGVVGDEMPESWPHDALCAQAVAARTYAVSRMLGRAALSYDVYDNQSDQVYNGLSAEDPRVAKAIQDTAGVILTYGGEPISAMYCSDCGTVTRTGRAPYLQSVASPAPESPNREWTISLSPEKLASLCTKAGGVVGSVSKVEPEYDQNSGHLLELNVIGSKGSKSIGANKLREMLGYNVMKSTQVRVESPGKASAPLRGNLPRIESEQVPGDSTEILLSNFETRGVQHFDANGASGSSAPLTVEIEPFAKPWIAWRNGQGAAKLRLLYAYNGASLVRCDAEKSVVGMAGIDAGSGMEPFKTDSQSLPSETKPKLDQVVQSTASLGVALTEFIPVGANGIVLRGSGYGHGVGMSQYGAKELAKQGWTWEQIVTHFYTGVKVEGLPDAALYCRNPAYDALPGESIEVGGELVATEGGAAPIEQASPVELPSAEDAQPQPKKPRAKPKERDEEDQGGGFYEPFEPRR